MSKTYDYKIILSISALLAVIAVIGVLLQQPWNAGASQIVGNDYNATSTKNYDGTELTNLTRLSNFGDSCRGGSLAQVTITGAGAGVLYFWDATTTDANLRAARYASSTILVTTVPASTAAGTYTFDAEYTCGLIYEEVGTAPTSTVMWR